MHRTLTAFGRCASPGACIRAALVVLLTLAASAPPLARGALLQLRSTSTSMGARVVSGTTVLEGMVGDYVVGPSTGGTTEVWHGFWAPVRQSTTGVDDQAREGNVFLEVVGARPVTGPEVRVRFGLPSASPVRLSAVDLAGRRVATLLRSALGAGVHEAVWDRRSATHDVVPAGIYWIVLDAGPVRIARKIVIAS